MTDSLGELAIETVGLSKRYGAVDALQDLTLQVPTGEIFGFLGPNGAGKTTATRLLLGLARATSGSGTVLGEPLGNRDVRSRIGYLPELFRYQAWMRAKEVLTFHCRLARIGRAEQPGEIEQVLVLVGLHDRQGDRVATFSKGMQQRLGLAVALLGKPQLVILDEPTSALDPVGRRDVREIIGHLAASGTTVFLNSHLLAEVELVCHRVAIIDHGSVRAMGTLDELLQTQQSVDIGYRGDAATAQSVAAAFGAVKASTSKLVVHDIANSTIPELVAKLVDAKIGIVSVVPTRTSLEDRFLQMLGTKDTEP